MRKIEAPLHFDRVLVPDEDARIGDFQNSIDPKSRSGIEGVIVWVVIFSVNSTF